MIDTPRALKKLCNKILTMDVRKPQQVSISHSIYRLFTQWQFKDKFPSLLGYRDHGAYFLVKVR